MQALPEVPPPADAITTASGIALVTSADDIQAVLAADAAVKRSRLPSNRNSVPAAEPRAPNESPTAKAHAPPADAVPSSASGSVPASGSAVDGGITKRGSAESSSSGASAGEGASDNSSGERLGTTPPGTVPLGSTWQDMLAEGNAADKAPGAGGWAARRTDSGGASGARAGGPADPPMRVGGGIRIPAGGAPPGSRLGAMVGDSEYYERMAAEDAIKRALSEGADGESGGGNGADSGSSSGLDVGEWPELN